jgi:tetratricopeptide (TPR) repeat protein
MRSARSLALALPLILAPFAAACGGGNAEMTGGSGGMSTTSSTTSGGAVCGGLQEIVIEIKDYPAGCAGLAAAEAFACAEQTYWIAMRQDFAGRPAAYDTLTAIIQKFEPTEDPVEVAKLYFRRGQLAMLLAVEDGDTAKILQVDPNFDKALELDPSHPMVGTWRDTMDLALAEIQQDPAALQKAFSKALDHVALCPLGNVLSLSGTTIGLPLSSGIPQQTFELVKGWKCEGVVWCTDNTWKAPYARPGLEYHFGEIYGRMGDKDTALAFFNKALAAPGSADWPWRSMAEDNVANIDAYLGKFAALGQDGSAFTMVYANQNFGCKFCHAAPGVTP